MQRFDDLKKFYSLLEKLEKKLGGMRRLSDCSNRMSWPERGVYFFFEPGEIRDHSGTGPRVVRIGTHALTKGGKATLWKRLQQHRGSIRSGGGNHRSSVFRRHLGRALRERDGFDCPAWGNERSTVSRDDRENEKPLEMRVSEVIGNMPFLWIAVEDEPGPDSMRGYIEKNVIALLSNYGKHDPIDPPSESWLGHHYDQENHYNKEKVRKSGLWNIKYVDEQYDPAFLDEFATLVKQVGEA